jgi:hypothetical protein
MALEGEGVGQACQGKTEPLIDQFRRKEDRGGAALVRQDTKKRVPGATPKDPESE